MGRAALLAPSCALWGAGERLRSIIRALLRSEASSACRYRRATRMELPSRAVQAYSSFVQPGWLTPWLVLGQKHVVWRLPLVVVPPPMQAWHRVPLV